MDFILTSYKSLLSAFLNADYSFQTFSDFILNPKGEKVVILRHDVDLRAANSLRVAQLEAAAGIISTSYFRAVWQSWDEVIIREIAALGHEVGYHYESLTTCKGDVDAAYSDFCRNLERLRNIVPVKSICMHGSPRSPYDSKDIWQKFSYKDLGIVGEPYFDVDFSKVFYLTDTGRRWDGYKVSVRDKIDGWQDEWVKQGLVFRHTSDIINSAEAGRLPQKIMITTHPQRWEDFGVKWLMELGLQNLKNVVKRVKKI